ncbi:MAG TPA: esterase family protein [Candidatus Corynebacterium faecigallinarum]|uniref:Esterase family protein n=1 Tax=Candidatus Corynebacterium faecigallinarum TaxID=2838528 RepID=A0A9D2QEM0_9CORY|nr:esterase family protein [Candidatus Corynebacterium faecigallinarum]
MNKRAITRVAAAAIATALPLSVISVTPALAGIAQGETEIVAQDAAEPAAEKATISEPFETLADAEADGYVPEDNASWRDFVYQDSGERYTRMEELKVHSPSMDRDIPFVTIRAKENAENAPTVYLLNGADGGEGIANWLKQTNAVDFYGNQIGNVNVVIPMAGAFSYYTDWQEPNENLDKDGNGNGNKQMWETFLTQELPDAMEDDHLRTSSDKRGLIGMSMTASTALVYGQQYPGKYDSIASYSGCPATSGQWEPTVQIVLDRAPASYDQMWGDPNGDVAKRNDALINAAKLKDQRNVYISSGSGLMGEHDVPSGDRLNGNLLGSITPATEGGVIEGMTAWCTHLMKAETDKAGISQASNNLVYNFRNTGTHQWGYWQDDMFESWPVISEGLWEGSAGKARQQTEDAKAAYLAANPGAGNAGSTPVSSLPSLEDITAAAETEDDGGNEDGGDAEGAE